MGKQKQMLIGVLSAAMMACGSSGGAGDDQQPQPATGDDPCRVRALDEVCANGACPSSPDEVPRDCGSMFPTERYATTCGGTMMSRSGGFTGANWIFDENDALVGLEAWEDLPHRCADGTQSFSTFYGSVCEREGEALASTCPQ